MLQIIIVHEQNSLFISEVRNLDTMESLVVFDEEKKCIDLSCLSGHEGETILVTHFERDDKGTRLDYEHEKILTNVDTDENGFMFVEYN